MFEFEAYEVFKLREYAWAYDCFKYKHNSLPRVFGEEIGHYKQALIKDYSRKTC